MRARAFGAAALASLALAACGSTVTSPTIIDGEKVERAIERSSLTQRGQKVDVSCPSGVHQKKGLTFTCEAVGRTGPIKSRVATRFVVTQMDDAGRVHYIAR